ncbi:NUDIX domain-containing protein [uncultured Roseobacter sp.]|uniref:NUDIX domain-containing protein n=1 Tax=uncultured Roseobacter sp. TaxID=114847 RepID=UPI0026099B06|nr:NUDIX domain-containing protein [uncultured Roseobacter sp.]
MTSKTPRIAVRAVIVHEGRLLIVNAWPDGKSDLMCAPGGGADPGTSLPENLAREVYEETGLSIEVGVPCMVNEFHDPRIGFHQIEVFFRCCIVGDARIDHDWRDPENIVDQHMWVTADELDSVRLKPDGLRRVAFSDDETAIYDPLETIVM